MKRPKFNKKALSVMMSMTLAVATATTPVMSWVSMVQRPSHASAATRPSATASTL